MEIKFHSIQELFNGVAQIAHQFGYVINVVDAKKAENSMDSGSIDEDLSKTNLTKEK